MSIALAGCFLLLACSEKHAWREEVRLAGGDSIAVERSVEIGMDEWARRGRGPIELQVLRFTQQGDRVAWSLERTGAFDAVPLVFDYVDGAPTVVLPLREWRSCYRYGFPASGLVAMSYRGGQWEILPPERLPMSLRVNLLQEVRTPRPGRDGVVGVAAKAREDGASSIRQGATLAEVSRTLNKAENSCNSMNPAVDRAQDQRIESFAAEEARAVVLAPESVPVSSEPAEVSGDEFVRANGKWFAPGYLGPSCQGIVSAMKPWYRWRGDETNALKSLVGTRFAIRDAGGSTAEIAFPDSRGDLQAIVCDRQSIVTIKRIGKARLIIHRFARNGQASGVFRVDLPGSNGFAEADAWGMLWNPAWDGASGLSFAIADYRYPGLANAGGTIARRSDFIVRLPDAPP